LASAYSPPGSFNGDGATYDPSTGFFTAGSAQPGQCLACHNGGTASDMRPYLKTGHKNMLKKVIPNQVWAGADGSLESARFTTDLPAPDGNSAYASGSTFDWPNALITIGNGAPTVGTSLYPPGTQQPIMYQFGGWADPTQLDTVFPGGFTGEQWPAGNYDCGRCHTTGYRFDDTGAEPTYQGSKISPANFSRVPTDYDPTDPSAPNASWMLDGVQCERCHDANGHTAAGDTSKVTKPTDEDATALCLQCHREENADTTNHVFTFGACSDGVTADYATCVGIPGNIWTTDLIVYDGGSCSDGVSPDYGTCIAAAATWNFAPFFDHESGPTFLNGAHGRFSGSLALANQNQTDMTLVLTGTYDSKFQDPANGTNAGCTGCHDPHQSLVPAVGANPFVKGCIDCHAAYSTAVTNHPTASGSPYDVAGDDQNATCAVCHMSQSYHLFRISTDPNYRTFPSAAQIFEAGGQASPNTAPDGTMASAVWSDLDLACGQCHVGSGLLTSTPTMPGITMDKPTLAGLATCMHHQPVIHASAGANGTVSPAGTIFLASGASQTLTYTAAPGYEVKQVTLDGRPVTFVASGATATYAVSNVTDCHTVTAQFGPVSTITASAGANGSIAPSGTSQVFSNSTPTYVATPAPNYQVATLLVDGTLGVNVGSNGGVAAPNNGVSYTFPPVSRSHTIVAYFTPITLTITTNAGVNGTIYPSTSNSFKAGSNQTFTFTPKAGYHVASVTVDGVAQPVASSYTFTNLQANHTVAATFAPNAAATITATAGPNGTITPSGTVSLLAGQSQYFSFTPAAGYELGTVTADGAVVFGAFGYTFSNIAAGAHTINATFVPAP
jgi:predicted CXXCH cytochrome family protein